MEVPSLTPSLANELDLRQYDVPADGLAHVVQGEGSCGSGGQGLHLHPGGAPGPGRMPGSPRRGVRVQLQLHLDVAQRHVWWQRGISWLVSLAAWMPASWATARASPS